MPKGVRIIWRMSGSDGVVLYGADSNGTWCMRGVHWLSPAAETVDFYYNINTLGVLNYNAWTAVNTYAEVEKYLKQHQPYYKYIRKI